MTNPSEEKRLTVPEKVPAVIQTTAGTAAAARERAIVEARALVAMHRPRDFEASRLRLMTASRRPGFARQARYSKPIGTKSIEGLSIRFAEEARVLWGNMDVSASIVDQDDLQITYRVVGLDLESNASDTREITIEKTVERKFPKTGDEVIGQRTNSKGETTYLIRANEDALLVKVNSQIAKARREVILSLIPADIKDECEQLCIDTMAQRDAKDPEGAKRDILASFFAVGVMPAQLAAFLDHPVEAITPAELVKLRSVYQSLRDGEATWAEVMESVGKEDATGTPEKAPKTGNAALRDRLKRQDPDPDPDVLAKPRNATQPPPAAEEDILAEDRRTIEADQRRTK